MRRHGKTALAVVAGLSVFVSLGYWMLQVYDRQEKTLVVVAARNLEAPRILAEDDIRTEAYPRGLLPKTALSDTAGVIGVTLLKSMSEKEVLTTNHLYEGVDAGSESLLVQGSSYAFSLPRSWLAAPPPKLAANDIIAILASVADLPVEQGTTILLHAVRVIKVDNDKDGLPSRLILELDTFGSAQLLQAHANRMALAVLLASSVSGGDSAPTSTR